MEQQVTSNLSLTTYCGEKEYYMRDCQVKKKAEMIKTLKAKEIGYFGADKEKYKPTDDESIKKIGL